MQCSNDLLHLGSQPHIEPRFQFRLDLLTLRKHTTLSHAFRGDPFQFECILCCCLITCSFPLYKFFGHMKEFLIFFFVLCMIVSFSKKPKQKSLLFSMPITCFLHFAHLFHIHYLFTFRVVCLFITCHISTCLIACCISICQLLMFHMYIHLCFMLVFACLPICHISICHLSVCFPVPHMSFRLDAMCCMS